MSAIFGERLRFGQPGGPDVDLIVTGDEFEAHYETIDGFTVVFDTDRRRYSYAVLVNGALVSTGISLDQPPPPGVRRHLQETNAVKQARFAARFHRMRTPPRTVGIMDAALTFGPSQGLLTGRQLHTGAVRGLTILVEFQDVRTQITAQEVSNMLNAQNYTLGGNFCSAREYFRIVSSGKLDYNNDVVGPFRLSRNRDFYIDNLLVKEALDLAVASGVDLRRYDSRHEGIVDALNILYAGQTQYRDNLWPHNSFITLSYGTVSTNLYLLTSLGLSASQMSIGTFCHENGHLLCRFPDMYDYGKREGDFIKSAGIGAYCLMGSGNHLNNGRTPAPVCAYLRDLARWCDTTIILNTPAAFETVHGAYNTVMKFETPYPNEYFIVENRSKLGLDSHLPSSGLAVYHCDIVGSNEFQAGTVDRHYQCALLQADGRRDLETSPANNGDGGDLFASVPGVALSHLTNPNSRLWDGSDSGLVISSIDVPGAKIAFQVGPVHSAPGVRGENTHPLNIPDNSPTGVTSVIPINASGSIKQLTVHLDISHTYIGDLIVELTGPGGQKAILHNGAGSSQDDIKASFDTAGTPALAVFNGRNPQGDWTLSIKDLEAQDIGRLNRWSLEFVTDAPPKSTRQEVTPNLQIPDNNTIGVSSVLEINAPGTVGQLKVSVDITHTYIGDLRLELSSPAGRSVILQSGLGGGQDNLLVSYDSATPLSPLRDLIGQSMQGSWTLRIADTAPIDTGTLNKWSLELQPSP